MTGPARERTWRRSRWHPLVVTTPEPAHPRIRAPAIRFFDAPPLLREDAPSQIEGDFR